LLNCLKALENQSLRKEVYEVIIASDGPDFETRKAMRNWITETNLNAQYIPSTDKRGPAATRNRGWISAQAPLIAFTDDDCLPDKNWLATLLNHYHGECFIAFSGKTQVRLSKYPTDFALNLSKLADASFITANCACTKKALIKIGGFDERFKMAWREDSDLEFKLISNHITIKRVVHAVVDHPVYRVKWGISILEQKKGLYDALLFKKHPQLYRNNIGSPSLWMYSLTVLLFLGFLYSILIKFGPGVILFGACYLSLLFGFTLKRLKYTSKTRNHVFEIICTSFVIPFLSVYYRVYGAIKFKTLFL
jgi:glycosyltransferase involved in cell wall biosynthesis